MTGESVHLLLDYSAEVNNRDPNEAGTPLFSSIQFNNHAALSIILNRTPNQNFRDRDGMGLLHILASCGDKRTFDILLSSGIVRVIRSHDKDNENHTLLEVFDIHRYLFVTENAATRSWCREALISLMNSRDNNPFLDDVPYGNQDHPISSASSNLDVFYDFDEAIR